LGLSTGDGGGIYAEELRNGFNIQSSIKADRITEQWRIGMDADFDYQEENIEDDEEGISTVPWKKKNLDADIVKSLSRHWSAGISADVYSTTYRNIDLGLSFSPAVQYNIFPWAESSQRILAIAYHVGIRSYQYMRHHVRPRRQTGRSAGRGSS